MPKKKILILSQYEYIVNNIHTYYTDVPLKSFCLNKYLAYCIRPSNDSNVSYLRDYSRVWTINVET